MTVFWYLLLGHLLADLVLKKDDFETLSFTYLAAHSFVYFLILLVCCFNYLSLPWLKAGGFVFNGWLCSALIAFIYFIVNCCGKYLQVSAILRLPAFILRQTVLILVLFLFTPIVSFEGDFKHYIWGADYLLIINFCLIITYGISAFMLNLSYSLHKGINTQGLFDKRFLNNLFRLIIFLLLIIPGFLFPLAALVLVFLAGRYGLFKDERNYLYCGCIITALLAILFRGIFY